MRKDVLQKHMKLSHENKNDEPVIGMWMIDGQQITPMRENVPMKNPLNEVVDIPQVIVRTAEACVNSLLDSIIEKVVSDNGNICKVCNKSYSSVYSLTKHMKNIHNITSAKKEPSRMTVYRRAKKAVVDAHKVITKEPKNIEYVLDDLIKNNKAPAGKGKIEKSLLIINLWKENVWNWV